MSKLILGLTGGIGSGKTTVTNAFAKLGVDIIDADIIAREVVDKDTHGLQAITSHFGSEVIDVNGLLDRAALRTKVFDKLSSALHFFDDSFKL